MSSIVPESSSPSRSSNVSPTFSVEPPASQKGILKKGKMENHTVSTVSSQEPGDLKLTLQSQASQIIAKLKNDLLTAHLLLDILPNDQSREAQSLLADLGTVHARLKERHSQARACSLDIANATRSNEIKKAQSLLQSLASEDLGYNDIKEKILQHVTTRADSALAARHDETQEALKKAKETIRSFVPDVEQAFKRMQQKAVTQAAAQKASSGKKVEDNTASPLSEKDTQSYYRSDENKEDLVHVPGVGSVDRNRYDIGNVESHDDGTHTIIDMTGRRYTYPPTPPSDPCTIS